MRASRRTCSAVYCTQHRDTIAAILPYTAEQVRLVLQLCARIHPTFASHQRPEQISTATDPTYGCAPEFIQHLRPTNGPNKSQQRPTLHAAVRPNSPNICIPPAAQTKIKIAGPSEAQGLRLEASATKNRGRYGLAGRRVKLTPFLAFSSTVRCKSTRPTTTEFSPPYDVT